MVNNNTVIVVGAGASKEANLPTGAELKVQIAEQLDIRFRGPHELLSGDPVLLRALQHYHKVNPGAATSVEDCLDAARRIRDALPQAPSIDNLIDAHKGDTRIEVCGKFAIVRSILDAESQSYMYVNPLDRDSRPRWEVLAGTWFNLFWQILSEGTRANEISARLRRFTIICFNYDRCVEHFLFHSLQNYYGLDVKESAGLINELQIFHPYGTVGRLPWQADGPGRIGAIEFGETPGPAKVVELGSQIRTFTEGTNPDSSDIETIRARITEAQILVFLGFAFHKQNLDLLRPQKRPESNNSFPAKCFGTAREISGHNCERIETEIRRLKLPQGVDIALRRDLTCAALFNEYWRTLAQS